MTELTAIPCNYPAIPSANCDCLRDGLSVEVIDEINVLVMSEVYIDSDEGDFWKVTQNGLPGMIRKANLHPLSDTPVIGQTVTLKLKSLT